MLLDRVEDANISRIERNVFHLCEVLDRLHHAFVKRRPERGVKKQLPNPGLLVVSYAWARCSAMMRPQAGRSSVACTEAPTRLCRENSDCRSGCHAVSMVRYMSRAQKPRGRKCGVDRMA